MNDHRGVDKTQKVLLNDETTDRRRIDTEVVFLRRKTWSLSRTQMLLLVVVFVSVLVITVLVTVFVMRSAADSTCSSESDEDDTDKNSDNLSATVTYPSQIPPNGNTNNQNNVTWNNFRLPKTMVPIKYDLSLTIDLDKFKFNGSVAIEILVKQLTESIVVNYCNLTIDKNQIIVEEMSTKRRIGIKSTMEVKNPYYMYILQLVEPLSEKSRYMVTFRSFVGPIEPDLRGLYLSSYTTSSGETRYLATSQLQSTDARKVFPCFDEPQLKAQFAVTITHQPEYTALSNTKVLHSQTLPNGWIKDAFQKTPVMSSYLLAFVVSDFQYKEIYADNLRIRLWSKPSTLEQTTFALSYAAKTYKYFTEYFAMPEPMPKADHVAVPDFSGGAMENWGLVIYRETSILYDRNVSSSTNKYIITLIVAHEIVHTWFGNIVTMKWWTDLWLNEGFACTLMFFAMDHAYPEWNVYDIQIAEDIFSVMILDALDTSHPVSSPIKDPSEIVQFFDDITYKKGMAILRMLRGFLGWDDFRKGLQNYVKRYEFDNADMSELWVTFSETVNHRFDVGLIMGPWCLQMGYPVVTITTNGSKYILRQERFRLDRTTAANNSEGMFGYKWYIPFTYKTQHNSIERIQWLNMSSATIAREPGWILGNVDVFGYYLVNYEEEMWRELASTLNRNHLVFSQANRAGLINNALSLARAGHLAYSLALNVTTFLKSEEKYVPWKAFLGSIQFLRGMLSTTPIYGLLQVYIQKLVVPVFEKVQLHKVDGTLPERYITVLIFDLACSVRLEKATRLAQDMFHKWMNNGTRIPADYARTVYRVGIREGGVYEWEFLWNKSRDTNVATEMELMRDTLTHTQQPWLLWRYMNWMFDERKIRLQDVRQLLMSMSQNTMSRMISRNFVMSHWKKFLRMYEGDWFGVKEIIPQFTKYVNTQFEYTQLQQLFQQYPPKFGSESANSALALIRTNIHWMEESYPAIQEWLERHMRPYD